MAGLIEAWVLAAALSVDAFVASFAYGSSRIHIPAVSVLIMDVIATGTLALSLAMGNWVQGFLPAWVTNGICFLVLLVLGVTKLFDGEVKSPEQSNVISPGEAASLALALSLDGLAAGFGAGMGNIHALAAVIGSMVINALAILAGSWLGNRAAGKLSGSINWLGGIVLIMIAVLKLC